MKDSPFRKEFFFIDGDIVSLCLLETVEGNGDELPFYWWSIVEKRTGENVGNRPPYELPEAKNRPSRLRFLARRPAVAICLRTIEEGLP